jgi:hypothetical protein
MRPVEFMLFDGDSSPNTPVRDVWEAQQKEMHISCGYKTLDVVSYYYHNGRMYLELEESNNGHTRS